MRPIHIRQLEAMDVLKPYRMKVGRPFGDEGISFHPLTPEHVAVLEGVAPVPHDLKRLWLEVGYGHIRSGPDGVVQSLANNFRSPPAIAQDLGTDGPWNAKGLGPEGVLHFFHVDDEDYLGYVLDGARVGRIVWICPGLPEISPSLAAFVQSLLADPFFYAEAARAGHAPS